MSPIMSSPKRALVAGLALLAILGPGLLAGAPARALDAAEGFPRVGSVRESQLGYEIAWGRTSAVTQLFALHTDPGSEPDLFAYCIEVTVHPGYGERMDIGDWDSFPGDNRFADEQGVRERVAWIVAHSYPQLPLPAAAAAAGIPGLTEDEAITGTQVAIWQLADSAPAPAGFEYRGIVTSDGVDTTSPSAQRVQALVDHLTGPDNVGVAESSQPELQLSPARLDGVAGRLLGPLTISASAGELTLDTPSGFPVTTADGVPVDPAAPPRDTALYLDLRDGVEAGTTTIRSELVGEGYEGLLLTSPTTPRRQTMIIAESREVAISATAELSWTAAPADDAPDDATVPAVPIEPGAPSTPVVPAEPVVPATPSGPTAPAATPSPGSPAGSPVAPAAPAASGGLAETGFSPLAPTLGAVYLLPLGGLGVLLRGGPGGVGRRVRGAK
ncbi:thioester domain-containing protein [Agromyces mediolanus]|uniref:thioester domain-containing protein n=1 Tax=Agromyces mediolanus TaxID=41986 RepID=UPI0038353AD2